MASRDVHFSYVDGIKVKISEHYKPPPRIILPLSYSQRLSMNDHIRKNMSQYDFSVERSIKAQLSEWKLARKLSCEDREVRFKAVKSEIEEIQKSIKVKEDEIEKGTETQLKSNTNDYSIILPSQYSHNCQNTNILIPTIAGVTPQPIYCNTIDKSPFNVSDFDPDTSSPFDNMALKSINDLEELALVLNKDKSAVRSQPPASYQMYNYNDQSANSHNVYSERNGYYYPQSHSRSIPQPTNVNQNYTYQPSSSSYDQHTISTQPSPDNSSTQKQQYRSTPDNSTPQKQQYRSTPDNSAQQRQQYRTVPNIMRSIQQQLDNTHLPNTGNRDATSIPKVVGSRVSRQEHLPNPFDSLEVDAQLICRTISSMGFPLARVARACDLIGNDDKKIVEYLLVMSDLMDLGFSETNVSTALVKCNNDKDKALEELLIL